MQVERKSLAVAFESDAAKQPAQAERPDYSGLGSGQLVRTSLASQAYGLIKDALIQGRLRPGLTIAFRDIAGELGMSVTPVREALLQLAAERILIPAKGRTIIVPQLLPAHCLELWGVRVCLEGYCAEIATAKATPSLADRMESIQARIAAAKQHKDLDAGMRLNQEFHFTLYQATEMPMLTSIIEGLWAQAGAYSRFFLDQHVTKRDGAAAQGPHVHSTIVRGVRTGDPTMVKQGIERDLIEIRDGILALMAERGGVGASASQPSAHAF